MGHAVHSAWHIACDLGMVSDHRPVTGEVSWKGFVGRLLPVGQFWMQLLLGSSHVLRGELAAVWHGAPRVGSVQTVPVLRVLTVAEHDCVQVCSQVPDMSPVQ